MTVSSQMTALRRVAPADLYEPGYKWNGACRCGVNDWQTEWWENPDTGESGYRDECVICGWWQCTHTVTGAVHTSDGLWTAQSRKTPEPTGCPSLSDGRPAEHTPPVCAGDGLSLV